MTTSRCVPVTILVALASVATASAHHSLANHDTTKAVRVKGTVVRFHRINPHSIIYLEEKVADGRVRRWAVEGPSAVQLQRRSAIGDLIKPGELIEVCGYLPNDPITWQVASPEPGEVSLAGKLITAELIVLPDGHEQSWGDYGVHRCFAPGYQDQHGPAADAVAPRK